MVEANKARGLEEKLLIKWVFKISNHFLKETLLSRKAFFVTMLMSVRFSSYFNCIRFLLFYFICVGIFTCIYTIYRDLIFTDLILTNLSWCVNLIGFFRHFLIILLKVPLAVVLGHVGFLPDVLRPASPVIAVFWTAPNKFWEKFHYIYLAADVQLKLSSISINKNHSVQSLSTLL